MVHDQVQLDAMFEERLEACEHQRHERIYASRGTNPMSNLSDGIFADSLSSELVIPVGSPSSGYAVAFQIGVSV